MSASFQIRALHRLIGLFFAPALIFFAFTGALQAFDLHKAIAGAAYQASPLIQKLAALHKDQVFHLPKRRPPPAVTTANGKAAAPRVEEKQPLSQQLLKIFVGALSFALTFATGFGIWMALQVRRDRAVNVIALIGGIVVPLALLLV